MPTLIPAAIGLGSSVFSGISGKSAAKKQAKKEAEMMKLVQEQLARGKEAMGLGKEQIGQGAGYLRGAQQGLGDLKNFWQPLVTGDRSAIDAFLAPERRAINQGWQATNQNLFRMAPRGGGRVSALAAADVNRQGALNDLVFGARREGANQLANLNQNQGQLGLGQMGVGASVLGQGLNAGNSVYGLYGNQTQRTDAANQNAQGLLGGVGNSLGGFLADIFKGKGSSSGGGPSTVFTQGFGGGPINL